MGSVKLDGNTLSSTELSLVSMGEMVEVASDAWIRVDASRKVVENILDSGETVYGINTGFGALVSESISSCLLYTSPSPRDVEESRMPSSA